MTSTRMVASLVDSKQGSNIKWIVFNNALNGIFSSLLGSGTLAHAFNNLIAWLKAQMQVSITGASATTHIIVSICCTTSNTCITDSPGHLMTGSIGGSSSSNIALGINSNHGYSVMILSGWPCAAY